MRLLLLHCRGVTDAAARRQQACAHCQMERHAPSHLAVGARRLSRVLHVDAARRWVAHITCFLAACCVVLLLGCNTGGGSFRPVADTYTLLVLRRPVIRVLQVQIEVSPRLSACCDPHAYA